MLLKIRIAVLSLWLGIAALFSFVVAPAAFKALPSRLLAGNVVNRVLGVTEIIGIIIGVLLLLLLWSAVRERGRAFWFEGVTLAAMTLSMVASKFVVSRSLHQLREQYGDALSSLPLDHPASAAFAEFHQLSVALRSFNLLATLVLIVYLMRRPT